MKSLLYRIIPLLLIFITSFSLFGQSDVSVYIRNINNYSLVPEFENNTTGQPKQNPKVPDDKPLDNIWNVENDIWVYKNANIIVRFHDQTNGKILKIDQVDAASNLKIEISVEVSSTNTISIPVTLTPNQRQMSDIVLKFDDKNLLLDPALRDNLKLLKGNYPIKIKVGFNNAQYRIANSNIVTEKVEHGTYRATQIEMYGKSGFWLPVLQFSSNLKSTEEGVPFASQPIGLAFGAKRLIKRKSYIGGSLMFNWLFYNQPQNSLPTSSTNSFTVKAVTYGVNFDFGNWITLGVVYGRNFQKGVPNPGYMMTIGFAPKLIQSVKAKEDSN